jgi:hypothetical protein
MNARERSRKATFQQLLNMLQFNDDVRLKVNPDALIQKLVPEPVAIQGGQNERIGLLALYLKEAVFEDRTLGLYTKVLKALAETGQMEVLKLLDPLKPSQYPTATAPAWQEDFNSFVFPVSETKDIVVTKLDGHAVLIIQDSEPEVACQVILTLPQMIVLQHMCSNIFSLPVGKLA